MHMGSHMKVFPLLVSFILLLGSTWAQSCTNQATYTHSVAPTSDSLYIDSLNSLYNNFQVEWTESLDGNVDVTVSVCSDNADDFNSLLLSLTNEADGVHLTMDKGTGTTGGDKGVYTSAAQSAVPNFVTLLIVAVSSSLLFPKRRISIALLFLVIALALNAQMARADSSGSTQITIKAAVPDSMNAFCVSGQCFYRNISGPITTYVSLFGKRFAALDQLYGGTCDTTTIMQVPAGWSLAAPTPEALLAIYLYNWNTYTVVTSDGTAYQSLTNGIQVAQSALDTHSGYFGTGVDGYSVANCDSRILITQDFPIPEIAHEIVGTPIISNFITFNGHDYATADNTAYSNSVTGCQTFGLYVDGTTEWEIAPDEDASIIVIQAQTISWGAQCLITSDGNSYMSNVSQCNAPNPFSVIPYSSGNIYSVAICSSHASRILVRRNSTLANTWATEVPITNTVVVSGGYYALLDNTSPSDLSGSSCQSNFMAVPTGWRLVTPSELATFVTTEQWAVFDTTYCIATAGLSLDHTNATCAAQLLTMTVDGVQYYQTSTCGRILIIQSVARLTDFTIGMKILLLSVNADTVNDVQANLALTIFNATGANFDWLYLLDSNNNPIYTGDLPLLDDNGNPKYYAIVLSDGQLSWTNPSTGVSASILTAEQQEQLTLYKYQYSVRMVALISYPTTTMGVGVVATGIATEGTYVGLDVNFVANNQELVGGIVTATQFDISTVYYIQISYSVNSTTVVPVVRYTSSATATPSSSDPVGAAIITMSDGTEELHFFLGNSATFNHGPIFANVWLNWVTKGLWLGNRRVYFIPQIDDLFLSTEQFDNPLIANRMTGDDLRKTRTFLDQVTAPPNSTINIEFGINGAGVFKQANTNNIQDDLYDAVQELWDKFSWESHTFTHLDFTCPEENCELYGTTSYEAASLDLSQNIDFFISSLFAQTGGLDTPTFSKNCMITPAITGLFNGNALKAILDNGITCVVGDNSQPDLIPDNLYHGIVTSADVNGYGGVFVIPRAPTEIYFDVSTPASEVIEYNTRYGIHGSLVAMAQNSTLDDIMLMEGTKTARNLMLLRHDPYMFHQGNNVHFNYTRPGDIEREWSLLTMWIQSVLEQYNLLLTFPLLNVKHDDLWNVYLTRMASDACGQSGTITISGGVATQITVSGTGSCTASITGATSCGDVANCVLEHYGPDVTVWAPIDDNSVTLPLSLPWSS